MGVALTARLPDLDMPQTGFTRPDLTGFCQLDDLGLTVTGQKIQPRTGHPGMPPDRTRPLVPPLRLPGHRPGGRGPPSRAPPAWLAAHYPSGHPAPLPVHRVWARVAPRPHKRGAAAFAPVPRGVAVGTRSPCGRAPAGIPGRVRLWPCHGDTANNAVLAEGQRVLIDQPARLDGVRVIGVDEHVWRHTRRGDKYVTVIIDLTGVHERTGAARLVDMVPGRSKAMFKTWLGVP